MKCYICDKKIPDGQKTREHVCPKWLIRIAKNLGCREATPKYRRKLFGKEIQNIKPACAKCNIEKGGKLMPKKDLYTRIILASVSMKINELLEEDTEEIFEDI